ncbi:MAG: hypothetical protein IJV43_07505 [Oscillospiraceae bacterium]|nr:hypothetical protein [Oscillospiraceae bacterium]
MRKSLTAEILKQLSVECPFPETFEDTEPTDDGIPPERPRRKIMHFRADHDGWRWYNTIWLCHDDLATVEMKREIDATYDALIAEDALADLPVLRAFCHTHPEARANENATDEYNFYLRGTLCDYWLRLITRERDYNMYLSAYAREPEEKPNPYQKYFDYLNRLRESGETNMWGAVPYLQREFPELGFDKAHAREIHSAWMKSFQGGTEQ